MITASPPYWNRNVHQSREHPRDKDRETNSLDSTVLRTVFIEVYGLSGLNEETSRVI